jgi:hypothetical protein
LEIELDRLMTGWAEDTPIGTEKKMGLAEMITNGITTGTEYRERLEQIQTVSAALAEARREIAAIDNDSSGNLTMSRDYRLAQFKVDTLNAELSTLQERLNLLSSQSVNGNSQLDTQTAFDKVSVALAEAKEGLATLESQLGYTDLDYRIAQDKVNNLDNELANLTTKLSSMLTENVDSVEMTDYFVMGNPSIPIPVLPERVRARNVLMIGAIVGVGGAWVALNFRWIAKGMPSSSMAKPDELEEE